MQVILVRFQLQKYDKAFNVVDGYNVYPLIAHSHWGLNLEIDILICRSGALKIHADKLVSSGIV